MGLLNLYFTFIKLGLLCFGGGYVLIPLLIADFVGNNKVLSTEEFSQLVAVAEMTPGPIGLNTATYVGYKLYGIIGGVISSIGLITPAFALVLFAIIFIKKFEKSLFVSGLLQGVRPAALGLIFVAFLVFVKLSLLATQIPKEFSLNFFWGTVPEMHFCIRLFPLLIAATTVYLQLKTKISFLWLIFASAVVGALYYGIFIGSVN